MSNPSPSAHDGRDNGGRFAPGNRFSKGNPYAQRVAKLRAALLEAVTEDDLAEVAKALIDKAKTGDVPAVRELLDRTLGRPTEADLLERLEQLEAAVATRRKDTAHERQ